MEWCFRGFDAVGKKKWVYGDLVHNKRVDLTDRVMVGGYEVVPESVGVFIGLIDKNGNKIYENDIIKDRFGNVGYIRYDIPMARFEYGQRNENGTGSCWSWLEDRSVYEVIGNLFENKDMVRIKNFDK